MIKILTIVFLIIPRADPFTWPGRIYKMPHWEQQLTNDHLVKMTSHMVKDAFYKLRLADRVAEDYRRTLSFELGVLTAGILDRFYFMVQQYRYYSYHYDFKSHKHDLNHTLIGLSAMQTAYDQLKLESDIYYKVQNQQLKKEEMENNLAKEYSKKYGMSAAALKKLIAKGMDPTTMNFGRRSMKEFENGVANRQELKKKSDNKWTIKNRNMEEEEFKKNLRYMMWAEKWNGFNPELEGIPIANRIARMGLANASDFLEKEIKGV